MRDVGGARETDGMKRQRPHIDEILAAHMTYQLDGLSGLRRRRIETAERHLRLCMEVDGPRVLTTHDRAVLDLERQFTPHDAFLRTMHADDLLLVLNVYVREPWLLPDRVDRRAQLRFADALAGLVLGRRLVDRDEWMCELLDLRAAIDVAKSDLKRERSNA